ncbi:hypothetical protein Pmar_PMAR019652 [Perkinsus marinus ATCC 50983]|uniref:Uncharacterized protein n=1 Tax=Perkinsus marinus (strain ATCC 50983 / TXsc) TaxID=423536 RepID=C5LFA3_PERM5|nr:hypothetical protein Pmar_PMAR019652 [Perkinsus marinus ATCC 50983]EER04618.1 hypothetical protein Pmar_PMAR019652 [Perkinsus marinus ATCC 50983]|eukprot:XP_002772802.1 hypothetical protein Pmar_PMAR019652 [Perkinsus marinus ATCC 50983]
MTYNGRANEALEHALKKAHEKCAGSLGRYISFDIQNSGIRKVTLEELLEYCNKWYDKEIDKFEDAWKPEIGPHKDSGGRGYSEEEEVWGEYYIRAELDHGLTITNGNVVWYCMQIWPDAVIDKLGTRWRPRSNAVARGKTHDHKTQGEKGGVYVADEGHNAVACIGSPMLCRAVMPILAAMAAGIPDAKMVASCAPEFDIFWEYVGWNKHMPPPEAPPGKSDGTGRWRNSRAYDQENNEDDTFMATLFMQENDALLEQLWCSVGEYNRTAGHWTGGNCNPGVSWSRDDFVDQLMLWWPFALIEEVGRFRYRPEFMDKGGVYLDLGGYYTCVQTKEAWAQAMMCMLSSIMCGIPSEIAALLPACDPFWDLVVDIKGPEAVRAQREAIRDARDSRFGEAWQRQRFFKLYGSTCEFRPSVWLPKFVVTGNLCGVRGG